MTNRLEVGLQNRIEEAKHTWFYAAGFGHFLARSKKTLRVSGGFPGGPVVKTLHSQCRGPGFDPWSGN